MEATHCWPPGVWVCELLRPQGRLKPEAGAGLTQVSLGGLALCPWARLPKCLQPPGLPRSVAPGESVALLSHRSLCQQRGLRGCEAAELRERQDWRQRRSKGAGKECTGWGRGAVQVETSLTYAD